LKDIIRHFRRTLFALALGLSMVSAYEGVGQDAKSPSALIEAAGKVEYWPAVSNNWQAASVGLILRPGDRVRTRAQSRAAVQLSDRSVIRLDELTTLEILPPRNNEKKRFGLPRGSLYFFNREKPADVEFDTPLAAGAVRGTEFLLSVAIDSTLQLALIDGLVSLTATNNSHIDLQRGEELQLVPEKAAEIHPLVNAAAKSSGRCTILQSSIRTSFRGLRRNGLRFRMFSQSIVMVICWVRWRRGPIL